VKFGRWLGPSDEDQSSKTEVFPLYKRPVLEGVIFNHHSEHYRELEERDAKRGLSRCLALALRSETVPGLVL
jgi:hypothetical protein